MTAGIFKTGKVPCLSGGHNIKMFYLVQLRLSLLQSRQSNPSTCYRLVRVHDEFVSALDGGLLFQPVGPHQFSAGFVAS